MFESLSRTVTRTKELSAFICVIPRGTDSIPPCLDHSIESTVHGSSVVLLYLESVRYSVPYVLDAHDEWYINYVYLCISSLYVNPNMKYTQYPNV